MFHSIKNDKTKQFDDALEQYNKNYETLVGNSSMSVLANDFKDDITKDHISDTCQHYKHKARSDIQKLRGLHANVSNLEPQTEGQTIQKTQLRIKINEQLIQLLEFIEWVITVKSAYNQGYADGLRKAEEKPMD